MSESMIIREAILASKEIHEIYMRRLPEQARPLREEYCQDYEREKIIEKHIDAATRELRARVKVLNERLRTFNMALMIASNEKPNAVAAYYDWLRKAEGE